MRVWVKLYDAGLETCRKFYTFSNYSPTIDDIKSRADIYGYHEFQMWEFMQIFGEKMGMGNNPEFHFNILFSPPDFETVELSADPHPYHTMD